MIEGIGGISSGFDGMAVGLGSLTTAIEQVIGLAANLDSQITGIFDSAAAAVGEGLMTGGKGVFNFAKDSVQTGMEFDTVMSNIAATMGKSRDEIDKTIVQTKNFTGTLGEFAEKLGAETKFTTAQAAQGLLVLAQAGLKAGEQIEALPPILSLASAGAIDLDTSATYVTAAVMGFGDSMENASYYADMISKGATLAKTDVNMLGAAFSGAAATASTYNQTAQSTETALLRLANMNVTGMEAANAYNRVMMDLFTATGDGKKALDELGISMYDASTGEARDLNDIINELSAALSKYNDETRLAYESQIFSAWGMKAFDKMAATSTDTLVVFNTELSNVTGAASKQAGTQLEALSGKLAILNSAFEAVKIQISKMIMPEFGSFVEQLSTGLGKAAEQLSEGDFKGAFYALGNTIVDLINQGADDILNSEDDAKNFVDSLFVFVKQVASAAIDRGAEVLPVVTDLVLDLLQKGIDALTNIINDPEQFGKIKGTINLILTKIQAFLDENEDAFYDIFDAAWDVGIGAFSKVFKMRRKTTYRLIFRKFRQLFKDGLKKGAEEADDGEQHSLTKMIGENILKGISQGFIVGLPNFYSTLQTSLGNITDFIAGYYKIESPSKVMRDKIGKNLALGIGEGFSDGMIGVEKQMKDALPTDLNITPEIVTRGNKGFKAENYSISFNIQNVNGATKQDAENFAEVAADMLYRRVKRQKAAVI